MKNSPYINERAISWKILIPHDPEARVLTIGLDPGCLKGLSRTWPVIDYFHKPGENLILERQIKAEEGVIRFCSSFDQLHREYDIVVIANNSFADPSGSKRIVQLLNKNGVLILMKYYGGVISNSLFKKSNFTHLNYYSALPQKSPRILIPLKNKRVLCRGLCFHTPGSFFAGTLYKGVKLASRMGFKFHLSQKPLIIAYRSEIDKEKLLTDFLSKSLGTEIEDLTIYTGSDQMKRKITALAVMKKGKDLILKIADTKEGCAAIQQESNALNVINTTELACHVPDLVVKKTNWQNYCLQVQSEVSLKIDKQIHELTEQHYLFLVRMSFIDRKIIDLNKTQTFIDLIDQFKNVSLNGCSDSVMKGIKIIRDPDFAESKTICHRTHGDFTPWNIKSKGQFFFVVDWEDSLSDGLILTDIFHFIFRHAALVGPWQSSSIVLAKIRKAADIFITKAKFSKFDYSPVMLVWLLTEYMKNRSKYIEEVIDCFVESWDK